jgi:hypothetical protein
MERIANRSGDPAKSNTTGPNDTRWKTIAAALNSDTGESRYEWDRAMKEVSWAFLAFVGSLIFLVLFIADRQMNAGLDRLSKVRIPPQSVLDADPDLKLITERSPYMRTER